MRFAPVVPNLPAQARIRGLFAAWLRPILRVPEGPVIHAVMLGLFMLAAGIAISVAWRELAFTQRQAEERLDIIAQSGGSTAALQIQRTVDAVLGVQALMQSQLVPRSGRLLLPSDSLDQHFRETVAQGRAGLADLILFDEAGVAVWSTGSGLGSPARGTVTACWDYLGDAEKLQIGRPRRAAALQQPVICLRHALRSATGELMGFVGAIIDAERLSASLRDLQLPYSGVVTLLRDDGAVLARSEGSRLHVGMVLPSQAMEEIRSPQGQGLRRSVSVIDGRARHTSWVRLSGLPATVWVGIGPEPLMAFVMKKRRTLLWFLAAGLASLATAFAAAAFFLNRRRGVAERGRAQESLERAEAARRTVFSTIEPQPAAGYHGTIDVEGWMYRQEVGPQMTRITGAAELPTMPGGAAARRAFFRRVSEFGEHVREYQLCLPDGSGLWIRERCRVSARHSPLEAEVVGVVTDIEVERQMRGKAETVARLALLGQMAASIAHEMNQPLAAIAIAAEVSLHHLETEGGAAKAQRRIRDIVRQAGRMRVIADHLRIFSRADDGPLDEVRLEEAVYGAVEVVGGALRIAGVKLELVGCERLPPLQARLVPLEQVLVNLLLNARDAMAHLPAGDRLVTIAAEHRAESDWISISVRDHGQGLPEGMAERAFEPFFTTKPVGEGTGLGLSIVYGTILGFGGEIALRNHPEGGAEMTIRLRVAIPAEQPALPPAAASKEFTPLRQVG
ncbi:MAG: putative sensor histidine kinase transcriptional regulatory protein [Rubritepida sp.]|nr:putative sensor histidine kinase transcriptional regulatory protein [Rubritepida sp.]